MKKERIFWGLFFLLAAVLVILNRFSLFAEISLIRLLVTIALVIWLLQSIIHRSMTGILFSIAFLFICYDDLLPLEPLTPGTLLLAATFASIGFHFLIPRRSGSFDDCREARDWADAAQESVSDNCVRLKTTMGTGIKYVSSADFQQADIECSMGAMKVYFDNAHIVQESAVIRLSDDTGLQERLSVQAWKRLNELYAANGQVGFLGSQRVDGKMILPEAVKVLVQKAGSAG